MMVLYRCILFIILSCCTFSIAAQNKTGRIIGRIENLDNDILSEGAIVKLTNSTDTIFTMVINGDFFFKNVSVGKSLIEIKHQNFKPYQEEVTLVEKDVKVKIIKLEPIKHELDAAIVATTIPKITVSKDTIKFNAAAVKLLEGDETIEILKQMPGVEVSKSGIRILGQSLARTYVDGKLIFGNQAMTALVNLPASDVISINTYEEFQDLDTTNRRATDKKVRVVDIKTKSKLVAATSTHFLASGGQDIEKQGKFRYGVGATGNFFSENLLFGANVFFNNINRRSNKFKDIADISPKKDGENTLGYGDLSFTKNWGENIRTDNIGLTINYIFNNDKNKINRITDKDYLPSDDYQNLKFSEKTNIQNKTQSHNINTNFRVKKQKLGSITWKQNFTIDSQDKTSNHDIINQVDKVTSSAKTNRLSQNNGSGINENISLSKTIDWFEYVTNFDYRYSKSNGHIERVDTLSSSVNNTIIKSDPNGHNSNFRAGANTKFHLTPKTSKTSLAMRLGYEWSKTDSKNKHISIDHSAFTEIIDSITSYNYTQNHSKHVPMIGVDFGHKKTSLSLNLALEQSIVKRSELFPKSSKWGKEVTALLPSLNFRQDLGFNFVTLKYTTQTILPSLEQWRNQLNNNNPLQLYAGRDDLKHSYAHTIQLLFSGMSMNGSYVLIVSGLDLVTNVIGHRTNYYREQTYLPEWDYTAPANSSLRVSDNVGTSINAYFRSRINLPLRKINCQLSLSPLFTYTRQPYNFEGKYAHSDNYIPSLNIGLISNFSRKFKISLTSNNTYIHSTDKYNSNGNNKTLKLSGSVNVQAEKILKHFYSTASYNISNYQSLSGHFKSNTNNVLNFVLGCRLVKGNLDISFACYDILNNSTTFTSSLINNYIQNTYNLNLGRFYSLNIGLKLYRSKSGLTRPKDILLKDGGIGNFE